MIRKIILLVLILAVLLTAGAYFLSRKAPVFLRDAIQRSLNKTVQIQAIQYSFPWKFELEGFRILEVHEPFVGEICFAADRIYLDVSPVSLSRRELVLDRVEVNQASAMIRNRNGKLLHALSDVMAETAASESGVSGPGSEAQAIPLSIRRFQLQKSRFQYVDYDVDANGFVIALEDIDSEIKNISLPPTDKKTHYKLDAKMPQGRGLKAGELKLNGWTNFENDETDAFLSASDLYLPYYQPYVAQVTPAKLRDGFMSVRASIRIHDKEFMANADFELSALYFDSYEGEGELFGLKAEEVLELLKDSSGKLRFQAALEWMLDQRPKRSEIIRRAIEQSLKKTALGSAGNILENTLRKLGDKDMEDSKEEWEKALKKVKGLFR